MKPPHHKITAPLRIIDNEDPAWDDRWLAETDGLEPEQMRQHPVLAYSMGTTHFDLDAPGEVIDEDGQPREATAREYLLGAPAPRVFEARRLSVLELATCLDRGEHVGRLWAFQLACKRIENDLGLHFDVPQRKPATDGQVQAVAEAFGADVLLRIGKSIMDASRAPNASERGRSGSSRGEKSPPAGVSPGASSPGTATETA